MNRIIFFITFGLLVYSTSAQCYHPNIEKGNTALAIGKYAEAYNYYSHASKCPDASRFDDGREARDGMRKCLPTLTVNGQTELVLNVGSEAGQRTFVVKAEKLTSWYVSNNYPKVLTIEESQMDGTLTIKWGQNNTIEDRSVHIQIVGVGGAIGITATIRVIQAKGGLVVNGQTQLERTFPWEGGTARFDVAGLSRGQQYTITGIDTSWMSVQKHADHFFVIANQAALARHCELQVVCNTQKNRIPIMIHQDGCSKPTPLPIGKIPVGNIKIKESSFLPIIVNGVKGYINGNGEIVGLGNYYIVGSSKEYSNTGGTWCKHTGTYRINQYCELVVVKDSSGKKYNEVKLFSNNGELLELYTELIKNYKGDFSISIHVFDDGKFAINIPYNKRVERYEKNRLEQCELDDHIEYFTADGERIFTIESSYVDYYEEGIAFLHQWAYYDNKGEKNKWEWSLYDRRTGKMIQMPKEVRWINNISDGVILFEYVKTKNNPVSEGVTMPLYGYCDLSGNIFIKTKYISATPFSEGYAFVAKPKKFHCFIDMAGNEYFNNKYAWHGRGFSEGLAAVYGHDYDYRPTFIDKYGNVKIRIDFGPCDNLEPFNSHNCKFSCGVAKILKSPNSYRDHSCWLIDKSGNKIIDTTFEDATIMLHGLAGYKLDGLWGIINNKGQIVVSHNKDIFRSTERPFFNSDGTASLLPSSKIVTVDTFGNIIYGIITVDSLGNRFYGGDVSKYVVTDSRSDNKVCCISVSGLFGFYDRVSGRVIIKPIYNDALPFSEELAAVKMGSRWGFINTTGRMIIPTVFEQAKSFSNGRAEVVIDGKKYMIDKNGIIQSE